MPEPPGGQGDDRRTLEQLRAELEERLRRIDQALAEDTVAEARRRHRIEQARRRMRRLGWTGLITGIGAVIAWAARRNISTTAVVAAVVAGPLAAATALGVAPLITDADDRPGPGTTVIRTVAGSPQSGRPGPTRTVTQTLPASPGATVTVTPEPSPEPTPSTDGGQVETPPAEPPGTPPPAGGGDHGSEEPPAPPDGGGGEEPTDPPAEDEPPPEGGGTTAACAIGIAVPPILAVCVGGLA